MKTEAEIRNDALEEVVQICLEQRDIADNSKPAENDVTMTVDHFLGQGWMANRLAKIIRTLKTPSIGSGTGEGK